MKHIVFYSGGIGSWMAAKRVVQKHGPKNVILLFTDTKSQNDNFEHNGEDQDLYRFISETVAEMGCEFIRLEDGRNVWEVMKDINYIGNTRYAPCSDFLKQRIAVKYVKDNFDPENTILYAGIDWTEEHRKKGPIKAYAPFKVEFPMCEEPLMSKQEMLDELKKLNIEVPRLYKLGFVHNNCGGFCVRAGHGQFKLLYEKFPERFMYHEQKEQEMIQQLGEKRSILRDRSGGTTKPMTLREFRKRIENAIKEEEELNKTGLKVEPGSKVMQLGFDFDDFGGCGCFMNYESLES